MSCNWIIIDGYNLLHKDAAYADVRHDLQVGRQRLVRAVEKAAPEMADRISVVFDGRESGRDISLQTAHIEVLFSPSNRTADGVIERMVASAKHPERITVVTDDLVEGQIVSSAGAMVLSCDSFIIQCQTASIPRPTRRSQGACRSTLGDFFPD